MKVLRPASAFLGSALLGYAGLAGYRHFAPLPSSPATETAPQAKPPHAAAADPEATPPELVAARECTGAALAARLRVMLGQLSIDLEWADALAAEDPSAFPDLVKKLEAMPKSESRQRLSELFYGRWAALDPAGGAAYLKSTNNETGLPTLLAQWVLTDAPAALARAREYGEGWFRSTLNALAINHPDHFLKWAAEHPDVNPLAFDKAGIMASRTALQCLLQADPAQVMAWTKQYPETEWGAGTTRILAVALAKRSPDEALAWAKTLTDPNRSQEALMAVANVMANTQPEKALELFAQIPNRGRDDLMQDSLALFRKLGAIAPDKILETARTVAPGPIRDTLIAGLLDDLMPRNPSQAFALADSMGLEALPGMIYESPREIRTADQARQVLDAAQTGDVSMFRRRRATQAISAWLETDQAALATYLEGKMDTPFFTELKLQEAIAGTRMPLDPALAKVLGIRPEHEIATMVSDNPAVAAARLERVTDPAARVATIEKISEAWTRQDQGDAIAWAATLTNPNEQTAAWKTIAGKWLKEDPQQASSWVNGLPPGPPRDATVVVLVDQVLGKDPDLAWHWAGTLTDPALKVQALGNAALAWQKTDSAALRGALDSSALLPAEKAAVLQQLRNAAAE